MLITPASFKAAALEVGMPEIGSHPQSVDETAVHKLDTHWEITCPLKVNIFKGDIFKTNIVEVNVLEMDISEVHVSCHFVVHVAVLPVVPVQVAISPLTGKVCESSGSHRCIGMMDRVAGVNIVLKLE